MNCEQQLTLRPESATLIPMSKWRWAGFQEGQRASTHARLTLGSTPAACVGRVCAHCTAGSDMEYWPTHPF